MAMLLRKLFREHFHKRMIIIHEKERERTPFQVEW